MRILHFISLGLGVAMMGGAGIGLDYKLQEQKAEGPFNTTAYLKGFYDRFGNDGGYLGLVFRDSVAVDAAMPDAPAGWDAWYIDNDHWAAVFSDEQWLKRESEFAKIEAQVPELAQVSQADQELWLAYFNDTSTAYTRGDNAILLYVTDKAKGVNQPVLQKFEKLAEAHFKQIETRHDWRSFNDQPWQEVKGPITRAENGLRPHKLQMFEAELGSVTIFLETRASEQALAQFLNDFDLSGLRQLGNADVTETAGLKAEIASD